MGKIALKSEARIKIYKIKYYIVSNSEWFKPEKKTVRQLLGDSYNFYNIPEYQRPYKWKYREIEELITDIEESMDNEEYFIGSMILVEKNDHSFDVIDGQQRLTTLTLILSALYQEFGFPDVKTLLKDEIQNRERIRIAPRVDQRNEFQEGFLSSILKRTEPPDDKNNIFTKSYGITKEILKEHKILTDNEKASQYLNQLLDSVSIVRISTGSEGSAVKLFYVLNQRGTSLSNDEIIKVILYDKLSEIDRNAFMGDWNNVESLRKQVSVSWETFGPLEKIFTLYSYYSLGEKPRGTVYDVYTKMVSKGESPLKIINNVKNFAQSLLELHREHSRENDIVSDDRTLYPFYYLNDTVFWQLVLASAIDKNFPDFQKLVQEVFRLHYLNWISGHNSGNIRDISFKILQMIKEQRHVSHIISTVEKKISDERLEVIAFENLGKDVYSDKPKGWLKAVLALIEFDQYDTSGASYIELYGPSAPSIDHVLPEEWQTVNDWSETWGTEDASKCIYKLGNMALVNLGKNISLGNKDFKTKKRHYSGAIADERATRFKINNMIVDSEEWDFGAFRRRQEYMVGKLHEILKTP